MSPLLMPSMFTTATMPPTTVGNCTSPCSSRSAALSGMSERAEGHLLVLDLPDALARPERLIGDADTGLLFVGVGPFRIDRKRKGGAGAGNLGRDGRGDRGRGMHPAAVSIFRKVRVMEIVAVGVGKTSAGMEPGNRPIAECPRRPRKRCYGCMIIS